MKHLHFYIALGLITGCSPAPPPDARIAVAHGLHRYVDSTQTVAVGLLEKLGMGADKVEAEKKEVDGLLQQSQATLDQLDQLDPAATQQLTTLLAEEARLVKAAKDVQNRYVQEAQDLNSTKALMGAK
jgi:Skp family chaperone for outer membrane proteins